MRNADLVCHPGPNIQHIPNSQTIPDRSKPLGTAAAYSWCVWMLVNNWNQVAPKYKTEEAKSHQDTLHISCFYSSTLDLKIMARCSVRCILVVSLKHICRILQSLCQRCEKNYILWSPLAPGERNCGRLVNADHCGRFPPDDPPAW